MVFRHDGSYAAVTFMSCDTPRRWGVRGAPAEPPHSRDLATPTWVETVATVRHSAFYSLLFRPPALKSDRRWLI
jgi:hypothetical protein